MLHFGKFNEGLRETIKAPLTLSPVLIAYHAFFFRLTRTHPVLFSMVPFAASIMVSFHPASSN